MGKANKMRDCPAAGRPITAAECGRGRGVVFECPQECPFCPWSPENLDDFIKIEFRVDHGAMDFYREVAGETAFMNIVSLEPERKPGIQADTASLKFQTRIRHEIHNREHRPGKKLFDLWRESGWKGLSRDEPFVASHMAHSHMALLQVVRVVDDQRAECVDLLSDSREPFPVCDPVIPLECVAGDTLLSIVTRYPFFHRANGVMTIFPEGFENPLDFLLAETARLGGPSVPGPELRIWLSEHGAEVEAAVRAVQAGWKDTDRDSDLGGCLAVYRWRDGRVDLGLDSSEDFFRLDDADRLEATGADSIFVWLRTGRSAAYEDRLPPMLRSAPGAPGEPVWGHMGLYPDRVEISAQSVILYRPMREMMEDFFGHALEFETETVREDADSKRLGGFLTANFFREPPADFVEVMRATMDAHLRRLMDLQSPSLDGLSPREAAKRPELRADLLEWTRETIATMRRIQAGKGIEIDFGPMLEELGLQELLPEANARRLPRTGWWRELEPGELIESLNNPPDESDPRMGLFPEIMDYWEGLGDNILNSGEKSVLFTGAFLVLRSLIPSGTVPEDISYGDFQQELEIVLREVLEATQSSQPDGNALLTNSVQPALMSDLVKIVAAALDQKLGNQVRVLNGSFILMSLEALMRCLRRQAV